MPYLTKIKVHDYRHLTNIGINVGGNAQHLVLTGPNGSGKSTLLMLIRKELERKLFSTSKDTTSNCELTFDDGAAWALENLRKQGIFAYFDPFRRTEFQKPAGPQHHSWDTHKIGFTTPQVSKALLQIFVNQKTQQAYALVENDHKSAKAIEQWFEDISSTLAVIFDDPNLQLIFERDQFLYRIRLSDGNAIDFDELADGHKAAIAIVAELLIRKDILVKKSGSIEPEGIVLIDEIETHLHLKLQEVILPFLCKLFPKIQFIVATHSPAVIASVDNAIIYDLKLRQQVNSHELQGIRYGTLMTSHFGISSDFDLQTTQKLEELKQLYRKQRDNVENQRMQKLAEELSETSHALALEILLDLKSSQSSND